MTVRNIKTRWLRRTVIGIISVPLVIFGTVLSALLGIQENMGEMISDIIETWKL